MVFDQIPRPYFQHRISGLHRLQPSLSQKRCNDRKGFRWLHGIDLVQPAVSAFRTHFDEGQDEGG